MPVDERRLDANVELAVDERRGADEPHRHLHLARGTTCSCVTPSIPRTRRRRVSMRDPNATVARIAIFAAASAPLTSSVGSGSAKPRRCASASASGYSAPFSICDRMKFVVPLTMPSTRWTFATTNDSRSTLITGIAAQTDASKRSWTPLSDAVEKSSALRRATSCLFAETTGLPARRRSRTYSPVGSSPPITSATSAISGSSRIDAKSVVRTPSAGAMLALAVRIADERAHDPEPVPGRALDVVRALGEQPRDGAADVAVSEQRHGDVDGHRQIYSGGRVVAPANDGSARERSRRASAGRLRPGRGSCRRILRKLFVRVRTAGFGFG